jgi:hypothetical protein
LGVYVQEKVAQIDGCKSSMAAVLTSEQAQKDLAFSTDFSAGA